MYTSKLVQFTAAFAFVCFLAAGCSDSDDDNGPSAPRVIATSPLDRSTDVAINASLTATFSEPMDPATLTGATFTLTQGPTAIPVPGTVIYADSMATFWPASQLAGNETFTAAVSSGAQDVSGVGMKARRQWSFTTGTTQAPGQRVDLGAAADFAILAKAAISTVPPSVITGDIGVSPASATFMTGFALDLDASNAFSTSTQVTGNVYAADYAAPTPARLTTAVADMETAFTDAAARAPNATDVGAGDIGGLTLAPGVYRWGSGLVIPTDVTLDGGATDVWIFQVAQDLTLAGATNVLLIGGAVPENVFWQVSGLVDLGAASQISGVILCATGINLQAGASINGRLLAQTAVTLDTATVVETTR
ncbi:MAG: DUF3494 domain-containing protein [Planctomycetes bacterium]|nr:DUF3494 domain-containing protein [Planctomycetota bacterium]